MAKAKKASNIGFDDSENSNEDEDMMYHEDWVEPHQDFEPKHFEGIP
jgi:hypothetical protein